MSTTFMNLENGATSTLRVAHATGDGSLKVATGDGPKYGTTWPARVTAIHGTSNAVVIFQVSGRSADNLTIAAAIEGTSDADLPAGSVVEMRWTRAAATDIYGAINTLEAGGNGVPAGSNGQLQVKAASGFGAIAGAATGANSVAIGRLCVAEALDSIAAGYNSTAGDVGSGSMFALGDHCMTGGEAGCVAMGFHCQSIDAVGDGGCAMAFSMGDHNLSQSCASFVIGSNGIGDIRNKFVIGGGTFDDTNHSTVVGAGESQFSILPMIGTTTNTTPLALYTRGAGGPGNTVGTPIVRSGHTYFVIAKICGRKTDGSKNAMFIRQFAIQNLAGTTALVGSVGTIGTDINAPGWVVAITADDAADAVKVTVTGEANVHWTCWLDAVEVG